GPRLMVHPDVEADGARVEVVGALVGGALVVAERERASGIHWLFCTEREAGELAGRGLLRRLTHQYHWDNAGYASFDDFTAAMTSKRRKEVRRERARAQSHGLDIRLLRGDELSREDWDALYGFYRNTIAERGAIPYLKRGFYREIARRVPERVRAVIAYEGDRPVAGTLNFMKGDRLFGRYWGAVDAWDALHFECCYYRLIDYAIAEGVTRFEAGAQGQHKIARGFLPSATHSAHFLAHPGLRDAVARHLDYEADAIRAEMAMLADHGPFKSASDADLPDRSG
ncbi:MAG: GNAT family N-acetyltransferase, partial [Myxococcales bacterium]|nr:GNAT family N-acetyltransferase [Myxococcales bacterium]